MRIVGRLLWLCITIFVMVFAILFATSNETQVTLQLWPFETAVATPLWLALLSAFVGGGMIGALLIWGQTLAIRTKMWGLQRRHDKLQARYDLEHAGRANHDAAPRLPQDTP